MATTTRPAAVLTPVTRVSIAAVGALPTQGASADPSTPRTLTYELTDCTGPAGTPTMLVGFKQPSEGAALHLTTGAKYVFMRAVDAVTGEVFFTTPGFERHTLILYSSIAFTSFLSNPQQSPCEKKR